MRFDMFPIMELSTFTCIRDGQHFSNHWEYEVSFVLVIWYSAFNIGIKFSFAELLNFSELFEDIYEFITPLRWTKIRQVLESIQHGNSYVTGSNKIICIFKCLVLKYKKRLNLKSGMADHVYHLVLLKPIIDYSDWENIWTGVCHTKFLGRSFPNGTYVLLLEYKGDSHLCTRHCWSQL